MKSRFLIFLIFIIVLLNSCSSTTTLTIYTDQQLTDGAVAVKEMMKEAYAASIEKTRDGMDTIDNETLFNPTQRNQFQQGRELPGVEKRLNTFKKQLNSDLNTVFDSLFDQTTMWIDEMTITDPYNYILGEKDSITKFFRETAFDKLNEYLIRELNDKETLKSTFNNYLTIINAYIITGKTSLDTNTIEVMKKWDPSNLTAFLANEIAKEMATQETIIRYLAPSYDSPYIQLFSK